MDEDTADGAAASRILQFQPLQSAVDVSFWSQLGRLKLQTLRLSEGPVSIIGSYTSARHSQHSSPLHLDEQSLAQLVSQGRCPAPGSLYVLNSKERLRTFDRSQAIQAAGGAIWGSILSGEAEQDPSQLVRFVQLCYADLKTFRYHYWFAFPALKPPTPFTATPPQSLRAALEKTSLAKLQHVLEACERCRGTMGCPGAEPVGQPVSEDATDAGNRAQNDTGTSQAQSEGFSLLDRGNAQHPCWLLLFSEGKVTAQPLTAWKEKCSESGEWWLALVDPCPLLTNPGWPARNLLLLVAKRWGLRMASVVCLRERRGRFDPDASIVIQVHLPKLPDGWGEADGACPEAVGWEANARGKPGARSVDLAPRMDPQRLAEAAVDLNLRLMRWRAAPSLATQRIATARCLLLGAGTLGCAVARTLLGWGVRHITLVDSGRVAFSNPVRQSLYQFNDCLEGGRPKAIAAAAALQRIFPGAAAAGVELAVPMPGHPLADCETAGVRRDVESLWDLVRGHDVVFLLMDTRESRWLPTLLCAAEGRTAINAALGFDSFLVMRHGVAPPLGVPPPGSRLGCYFCNDVVAPLDSTVDRTLDQQCTVARPGLAPVAGALAVELMAALLQHPMGAQAHAAAEDATRSDDLPLGLVPHMVRGSVGNFTQQAMIGKAFQQCTACSPTVLDALRASGLDFVLQALQDPKSLEDLTGLTDLHQAAERMALDPMFDDDMDEYDAPQDSSDLEWTSLGSQHSI